MVYYILPDQAGTNTVSSNGDGYSLKVSWYRAYPSSSSNKIGYNIYIGTDRDSVFKNGPVYFVDADVTEADIVDCTPRQLYWVGVRPVEYNPLATNIDLPIINGLKYYPNSTLRSNITANSLTIPLEDSSDFPETGIIQVGLELIEYFSNNIGSNNLILNSINDRGINDTPVTLHNVDGYDGYQIRNIKVPLVITGESNFYDVAFICQCTFEYPHYPFVEGDGYKQVVKDLLTTDLGGSEAIAEVLPRYNGVGYHRTDPVELFNGQCVGSYIGGERYCADGYLGIGTKIRGFSLQAANNANQEQLLEIDGDRCVLLRYQNTGYRCACFTHMRESPLERCYKCHGTGFVLGYDQYFNPRRSDSRILVRFPPADDAVKLNDQGYESEYQAELWTLTAPTIKNRDVLIRFDEFNNEEFRYEVLSVTRNTLVNSQQGGQKLKVQRIRKTDPLYQILSFRDTSTMPTKIELSIESGREIPAHTHLVVVNQDGLAQQTTHINAGHNHQLRYDPVNGWVVLPVLGHSHRIL